MGFSEGLGELFDFGFADKCGGRFLLMFMGGQAAPSSLCRRVARALIRVSINLYHEVLVENRVTGSI